MTADLGFGRGFERYETNVDDQGRIAETAEAMAEFRGEPFFIFFHTYATHDPYTPPARLRELFVDPDYSGRIISDKGKIPGQTGSQRRRNYWKRVDLRSDEDRQHLSDLYDAAVRGVDEIVEELLATLEASGVADNTVVILLSDHGEEFQEHGG